MKTRIQITLDVEVEIEYTEEEALTHHHGWGNCIHATWKQIDEAMQQTVIDQFTAQHSSLYEQVKKNFRYISHPFD